MRMKSLLLVYLSFSFFFATAQNKKVEVSIESIPFGIPRFSVVTFKDYISLSPVFLTESFSAESSINLQFEIPKPTWVRVTGGGIHKDLIVHPGGKYKLKVSTDDEGSYLERIQTHPQDPNGFCDSLNLLVNTYVSTYNTQLFTGGLAQKTALFCDSVQTSFAPVKDSLFQTYLGFRLDELRLLGKVFSVNKMFSLRFAEKPFRPENPDYAYAFSEMYKGRFREILLKNKMAPARNSIHRYLGADTLLTLFSTEPFYPLSEVGEGAVLLGLSELISDKNYTRDELLFLMNQMADSSSYTSVKTLAANLYKKYKMPSPMDTAPQIRVENKAGLSFDVPTGFDKPVYLCFFDPKSQVISQELAALNELRKKVKEKVQFVPVIINAEPSALGRLQQTLKLNVDLFRNVQFSVLADFRLKSDCTCMLLTPDGRYLEPSAPLPTAPDAQQVISGLLRSFR